MSLGYAPAYAAVSALHTAAPTRERTSREAAILSAVVQHLGEWQLNLEDIGEEKSEDRVRWRRAVLEDTMAPTYLSRRGGPFWL